MIWTLQTIFGRFFDAMVGQVMDALGGGGRSSPWSSPRSGAPRQNPPSERSAGGVAGNLSTTPPAAAWQPVRDAAVAAAASADADKDLRGDAVKLVRYTIISLQPCHERILPDGYGEVLVAESMTAESFATWIVAVYLQTEGTKVPRDEKKYLRVAYEVLTRWPREPRDCCEDRKLGALEGIRDALYEAGGRTARGTETPPALETEPPSASSAAAAPRTEEVFSAVAVAAPAGLPTPTAPPPALPPAVSPPPRKVDGARKAIAKPAAKRTASTPAPTPATVSRQRETAKPEARPDRPPAAAPQVEPEAGRREKAKPPPVKPPPKGGPPRQPRKRKP